MIDRHKTVVNFMYFLVNHKHDWFAECFLDVHIQVYLELQDVYIELCRKHNGNSTIGLRHFFFALDDENKEILLKYVDKNYISFDKYKID